ncbi:MAG: primosomal protein N' [Anaeroplasmataceae bacterium]
MFCDVIVDVESRQVNKAFEYIIPNNLVDIVEVGSRVKVPFGTRSVLGFVIDIHESTNYDLTKLKEITEVLDINPVITKEFVALAKYMVDTYYTFTITALKTMIPSALKVRYLKKAHLINKDISPELKDLFKNDYYVIKNNDPYLNKLKKLEIAGDIEIINDIKDLTNTKNVKMVSLINEELEYSSVKAKMVLDYLIELDEDIPKSILINDMGISDAVLKTLESHGNIEIYDEEVYRTPYVTKIQNKRVNLNEEQKNAFDSIKSNLNKNETFLLHGVTGSGKTEIYLNIIEKVINSGKEAIVLVPEISLTPQMNARFKARFNDNVAILHSHLSVGEKYDEWRKIIKKEAKIVVGARSAIFAPFKNLGIIIVDEEHEKSYIQDTNPRYDAIDIAKFRSNYHNCPLVLGSATPRIESYYHALNGDYILLELKRRANNKPLPTTCIVDMREELKKGNRSVFSEKLMSSLRETYQNKQQSILFLNKRGFSSFVQCRECGSVLKCPNCDVSLTYHKSSMRLKCHYCGYEMNNVSSCPTCNSRYIKFVGGGTEKIVEALEREIPGIRVLRVDMDTTRNKNAHDMLFNKFNSGEADVLVGTQIIAKGLDFPNVALVGVVNADIGLKLPNYNANEVSFDLLEQVSGRAGRDKINGNVIIQSYDPLHESIIFAKNHDYKGFYKSEIKKREILFDPPFSVRVELLVSSSNKALALRTSNEIMAYLSEKALNSKIYGPAESFIFKLNNNYRYTITIKFKEDEMKDALLYISSVYQNKKDIIISITRM